MVLLESIRKYLSWKFYYREFVSSSNDGYENTMDEKILLETMDGFDEDAHLERMNRHN